MAYSGPIRRWEVYRADLEPAVGRKQRGARRPVTVISNDGFNAHFDVVTVLPLTRGGEKSRRVYPFEVEIPIGTLSDRFTSILMPHQIRTLSRLRILERLGAVSDPGLQRAIEDRLLEHLGIEFSLWEPEA
jgi:mRNA interferase MazF